MVTELVLVLLWAAAAVGLWHLTAAMAAGPEQVPPAFRAVLWVVKSVAVLVAAHASGAALLGADRAWWWTLGLGVLMAGTCLRFELLRRTPSIVVAH